MRTRREADDIDVRILSALTDDPRAPVITLAERAGLSRNTVHARVTRMEQDDDLRSFERRIDPAILGHPLSAFILVTVTQSKLDVIAEDLGAIPEVLEVLGLSGAADLLVQVAARDADDLYRIAGRVLAIDGVEKTTTSLVMRHLVEYRVSPLMQRR